MLLKVYEEGTGLDTYMEGCGMIWLCNPGVLNCRFDEVISTVLCGGVGVEVHEFGSIFKFGLRADGGCSIR